MHPALPRMVVSVERCLLQANIHNHKLDKQEYNLQNQNYDQAWNKRFHTSLQQTKPENQPIQFHLASVFQGQVPQLIEREQAVAT